MRVFDFIEMVPQPNYQVIVYFNFRVCLEDLVEVGEARNSLQCPKCRKEHVVPERGIFIFYFHTSIFIFCHFGGAQWSFILTRWCTRQSHVH